MSPSPSGRPSAVDSRSASGSDDAIVRSAGLVTSAVRKERDAASDAAALAVGVYASQLLLFVAGLVQKGLLGPRNLGFWTLLGAVWSIFALASLGVSAGATRQIPIYRAQGKFGDAAEVADTSGTFVALVFALVGVIVAVGALFAGGGWPAELRYGLVILGVLAPLRTITDFHQVIYQAIRRFDALSIGLLVNGAATLALQTGLVVAFGYWGMWLGLLVVSLSTLAVWRMMSLTGPSTAAFRLRVVKSRVRELAGVGFPILIYSQIWILFFSVDTFLVASMLDVRRLGFYALAISVNSYVLFLPKVVSTALFPRMQEAYAQERAISSIRRYSLDVPRVLAWVLLPAALGAVFYLLPVIIRHALPAFTPAIPATRVMVAGAFFLAYVEMSIELMITAGNRWLVAGLMLGCLGINGIANWIALGPFGAGILGAAIATSVSYAIFCGIITGVGVWATMGRRTAVTQLAIGFGTFAWIGAALWGVEALAGGANPSLGIDVLRAVGDLGLFGLLVAPLFVLGQRQYGALSTIWALFLRGARACLRLAVRAPSS